MNNIRYDQKDFYTAIRLVKEFNPIFKDVPVSMIETSVLDMIKRFETDSDINKVYVAGILIESFADSVDCEGNNIRCLAFNFDVSLLRSVTNYTNSSYTMLPDGIILDEV